LRAPFGEPTFTREFRNFRRCQARNVAVARVAFYAERNLPGDERCAILLTRALDGWRSMDSVLEDARPGGGDRHRMLAACGVLARRLHHAGFIHGCFYPRHIFVRKAASRYEACLIDLEKLRPLWFGTRDRVKDLEQFLRHCSPLATPEIHSWLSHYLDCAPLDKKIAVWIDRLRVRRRIKEAR
jgi:tRNA A-37 threonylcarbamoyl transferase component Bud32